MIRSLKEIDDKLQQIAKELGTSLGRDETKGMWLPDDFEERSIRWSDGTLHYLIQIYPTIERDNITGWNFWVVASYDKDKKRYWKQEKFVDGGPKEMIISDIDILTRKAADFFEGLTIDQLSFGVDLKG